MLLYILFLSKAVSLPSELKVAYARLYHIHTRMPETQLCNTSMWHHPELPLQSSLLACQARSMAASATRSAKLRGTGSCMQPVVEQRPSDGTVQQGS